MLFLLKRRGYNINVTKYTKGIGRCFMVYCIEKIESDKILGIVEDVLSKAMIKRFCYFLKEYSSETDRIIIEKGIFSIKEMFLRAVEFVQDVSQYRRDAIKIDLLINMKKIDRMCKKIVKKRGREFIRNEYYELIEKIKYTWQIVFHENFPGGFIIFD